MAIFRDFCDFLHWIFGDFGPSGGVPVPGVRRGPKNVRAHTKQGAKMAHFVTPIFGLSKCTFLDFLAFFPISGSTRCAFFLLTTFPPYHPTPFSIHYFLTCESLRRFFLNLLSIGRAPPGGANKPGFCYKMEKTPP